MIILILFLVLSISLNILLVWYVKKILEDLFFVSETIGGLFQEIGQFSEHLKSVHELETYYGDTVLQNLIRHSTDIVGSIKEYENVFELTHADLLEEEEHEEEYEE